jgi:hypothetical protein
MPTKICQSTLMDVLFQTLDIDESNAWGNNWKGKLTKLLTVNKIEQFVYRNYIQIGQEKYFITIDGAFPGAELDARIYIQQKDTLDKIADAEKHPFERKLYTTVEDKPKLVVQYSNRLENLLNQSRPFSFDGGGVHDQSSTFLLIRTKGMSCWTRFDQNIDAGFVTKDAADILSRTQPINIEYKQVYQELDEAIRKNREQQQQTASIYYEKAKAEIQTRLSNPQYNSIRLGITLRQKGSDRAEHFSSSSTGDDIQLDITVAASGSVSIKHSLSELYLAEYVPLWKEEVAKRGLSNEIDVEALRYEVKEYFTSKELEHSMWQRFILNIHATVNKKVGDYIEAIQATQKITHNIWEEGVIPKELWYQDSNELGGESWPKYMKTTPVIGGAIDGVIDEVIGLPMAVKAVYEIATDREKQKALQAVFTKEGAKQLIDGLKNEAIEIRDDQKLLEHFASKTTVNVAAMFLGTGFISKGKKLNEITEVAVEGAEAISDPKAMSLVSQIRKADKHVDVQRGIKEIVEEAGEEFLAEAKDELVDITLSKGKKLTYEELKAFWKRGNDFNAKAKRLDWYKYHELWIYHPTKKYPKGHKWEGQPRRFRLDSYDTSGKGKIVSRKATDLYEIKLSTFEKYCLEVTEKYPVGARIARKEDGLGDVLKGEFYLEIPESNKSFEKIDEYIKLAKDKYKITIVFKPE